MTQLYHDYANRLRNNATHTLTTKLRFENEIERNWSQIMQLQLFKTKYLYIVWSNAAGKSCICEQPLYLDLDINIFGS